MKGAQTISFSRDELLKSLIKEKILKLLKMYLKTFFWGLLQQMLEAELEGHLGYSKCDYENKDTSKSRNGHSKKSMKSNVGMFDLDIPHDRDASCEPEVVKSIKPMYLI